MRVSKFMLVVLGLIALIFLYLIIAVKMMGSVAVVGSGFSLEIPRNWFSEEVKTYYRKPVNRLILAEDPIILDEYGEVNNQNYFVVETEKPPGGGMFFDTTEEYFEWSKNDFEVRNELLKSEGKLPIIPGFVYSIAKDQSITPIAGAITLDNDYLGEKAKNIWLVNNKANVFYDIRIVSDSDDFYNKAWDRLKTFRVEK